MINQVKQILQTFAEQNVAQGFVRIFNKSINIASLAGMLEGLL